jgi:D-amino-acid dehydrogenase
MMRVAVVGGGVVGLCCAWSLHQRGATVTVFERGRCGQGTSRGNAGWITPGYSGPVASPGAVAQAFRWMGRADSPFLIRPRLDVDLARWLWRFWRCTRPQRYRDGVMAMNRLNTRTLELFDELAAAGVEFEMHARGLLFVAKTDSALAEYEHELRTIMELGHPGSIEVLDGPSARALEPALGEAVAGGILSQGERHVRPESLTAGLAEALRKAEVAVVENTPIEAIRAVGSQGWSLAYQSDVQEFDRVVVASGIWVNELLAPLGARLPLEAAKGYSLTCLGEGMRPTRPLYFIESRLGLSPYREAVRFAGTAEFAGLDLSVRADRIEPLRRASRDYLRDWRPGATELEWAGLRPLAPDTLPIIGPVPGCDGVDVATGHGFLGVTLGPATGAALAEAIVEDSLPPLLRSFEPGRWIRGSPG